MQKLDFVELGGTLFVPAIHKDLEAILLYNKYPKLKSLVIDTEDGLNEVSLQNALTIIQTLLPKIKNPKLHIFLRPRDLETLEVFLEMEAIQNIKGFVLPKFSLQNANAYMKVLQNTQHLIMPSIEGDELFDANKLRELRDVIIKHKERVVLVRFGLEDMLSRLGMRRSCEESLFDLSAPNFILGNFIATFKSVGFGISGGVYPCFEDSEGFIKDAKRDIKEGLFSKTIIHPNQIELLNEIYRVSQKEFSEAQSIIKSNEAVFSLTKKMAEKSTMQGHSEFIIKRAKFFGTL